MEEENNNGRVYPKTVLEGQVKKLQEKISERALVGALDHPPNDQIHLSQASHLVTKLWCEGNDVLGEFEILSTPNGKIVEALLNDNVKIGISSRGLGSVSESKGRKVVNEDFQLLTFDLVSDPSTKGAYPSITESTKNDSKKIQSIIQRVRSEQIFVTELANRIKERVESKLAEITDMPDDYGRRKPIPSKYKGRFEDRTHYDSEDHDDPVTSQMKRGERNKKEAALTKSKLSSPDVSPARKARILRKARKDYKDPRKDKPGMENYKTRAQNARDHAERRQQQIESVISNTITERIKANKIATQADQTKHLRAAGYSDDDAKMHARNPLFIRHPDTPKSVHRERVMAHHANRGKSPKGAPDKTSKSGSIAKHSAIHKSLKGKQYESTDKTLIAIKKALKKHFKHDEIRDDKESKSCKK